MKKFQTSLKPEQPHCHHVHIEIHRDTCTHMCMYTYLRTSEICILGRFLWTGDT